MTIHDYTRYKFLKKDRKRFVNRNHNVVPLQRQNMTPTCGRKKSHVWQQMRCLDYARHDNGALGMKY
jgi:hypothetical protein